MDSHGILTGHKCMNLVMEPLLWANMSFLLWKILPPPPPPTFRGDMCSPKGYGLSAVLGINRVWF